MHLQSLDRFDLDSVLLPCNYCQMRITGYVSDFRTLITVCRARSVAVQITKAIARTPIGKRPGKYNTYFYEPLESDESIERAVYWAMGLPDSLVITAGGVRFVLRMLQSAERFRERPSDDEMNLVVNKYGIERILR